MDSQIMYNLLHKTKIYNFRSGSSTAPPLGAGPKPCARVPGQLLCHWEGDLAVVELLGAVTLAERRRDRRGLDDAQ